jgi:hypothetical protein
VPLASAGEEVKTLFIFALPLLSLCAPLQAATIHQASIQKQDVVLLERVTDIAQEVLTATERIEALNRTPGEYSRRSHMVQLETLKDAINTMTRDLDRLAASRNSLDQADRKAVNRVLIAAVELAQTANAGIVKAGQVDTTPALSVEYRKLMEACNRQAGELVKALNAGIGELK